MSNIISFSLWGSKPKYLIGAIENCKLAPIIYPTWRLRFYVDNSVPIEFCKTLFTDYNAEIFQVQTDNRGAFYGMYWRFWVNDDPTVDRYLIRDCDSRLNWREKAAVDEWIASGKGYHIMRDHKNHTFPIQGGMWGGVGCKTGKIPNIKQLTTTWNWDDAYACDQFFLSKVVYPIIKDDSCVHDPYIEKKPFPEHIPILSGGTFVGQIFDENNKYYSE